MKISHLLSLLLLGLPTVTFAEEAALDAPYKHLVHPRKDLSGRAGRALRPKSDVLSLIAKQTSVKNQASRGSCSIFSATALLESLLVAEGKADTSIDLSEEWLQYLIAQNTSDEGSTSYLNFNALREHGSPSEARMPYVGLSWKTLSDGQAQSRCGHLKNSALNRCLVGHRDPALLKLSDDSLQSLASGERHDPDFADARREALENKKRFFTNRGEVETGILYGTKDVKELLSRGIALTLDIDFYYGAWNHRLAESLGINRNSELWAKGIVTYPERGSMDLAHSQEKSAGHSVLIVGYDDERVVEFSVKMTNGRMKKFKRKGVYYFKNSWGNTGFGLSNEIEGKNFPGYGMITQDYAEEYGQFFRLAL
jgi:hypothetical protein